MGLLAFLDHWWNLPFVVMVGLVAVFFALQLAGLLGAAVEGELDADAEVDAEADADADPELGGSPWHEALGFLGVGRVPTMVVWVPLLLVWGFGGLMGNRVALEHAPRYPEVAFPIVLLASLAAALVAVRLITRLAARFVDVGGHGATLRDELVGQLGVVASARVDARFGEVRVRDRRGGVHLVHGHTRGGEADLGRGERVVIVDWDPAARLFWVTACADLGRAGPSHSI